jgi:UDP-N-acetylmuramoyl-tripeptide--D-alanyl-D-alanine ligase
MALITTVAPAHMAAFDGIEGIAREKASILDGLTEGGIAVLPADLPTTPILTDRAAAQGARQVMFGAAARADFRLIDITLARDTTVVQAEAGGQPLLFKVQSAGRHFAMNGLAALAVAHALGGDLAVAALALGQWRPPAGRGLRERIVLDLVDDHLTFDLIDDAYNANPASMAAALDVLGAAEVADGVGRVTRGRRVAVLGDMLELGADEAAIHAAIARHPMIPAIDRIHCVGPLMRHLWNALPREKRGEWVKDATEMAGRAHTLADAGDVLLVKGSKASRVSLVVDAIRKLRQGSADLTEGPL